MKNAIKFFYNLDIDSVRMIENKYILSSRNDNYALLNVEGFNIDKYYLIYSYPNIYRIISNVNNSLVTIINGNSYILVKIDDDIRKININDIVDPKYIAVDNFNPVLRAIKLWGDKLDYLEYQMSENGIKYPLLRNSFSYYDGLTENSIQLLRYIEDKRINLYLVHNRISINDSMFEYNNPINIVIDTRIRDICEYLKDMFFNGYDIYDLAIKYLRLYSNDEIIFFMARFLYPSYYFDIYEKVVNGSKYDFSIITNRVNEYEMFLKKLYFYIKSHYYIPEIEWLNE